MADALTRVNPGQLITAELMNAVLQRLDEYETRISNLETGGETTPIISGFFPIGPVRVGTQLQVLGHNFARPADSNMVSVGGFLVDRFDLASDDTRLIFNLPIITFTGAQLTSVVTVRTRSGADKADLVLLPALESQQGAVVFSEDPINGGLGIITAGQTYRWRFNINSQTLLRESYELTLVPSNAVGNVPLDRWKTSMTLVNKNGGALALPLVCEPDKPVAFGVNVVIPGDATVDSSITLAIRARSVSNAVEINRSSNPITIKVGQATVVSDPRVQWVNQVKAAPTVANAARRVPDAETGKEYVEIPYGGFGLMRILCTFQAGEDSGGSYSYTAALDSPADGIWTVATPSPTTVIDKQPGENALIGINLTLLAPEIAGHPEERVLTLKATRTSAGALESFITINIRGYSPE